jgi:hypothetical protein
MVNTWFAVLFTGIVEIVELRPQSRNFKIGTDVSSCMSDELLLFLDIAGITLVPNIGRNVEGEVKYRKILSEEGFLNTEVRSRYFTMGNGLRLCQM